MVDTLPIDFNGQNEYTVYLIWAGDVGIYFVFTDFAILSYSDALISYSNLHLEKQK